RKCDNRAGCENTLWTCWVARYNARCSAGLRFGNRNSGRWRGTRIETRIPAVACDDRIVAGIQKRSRHDGFTSNLYIALTVQWIGVSRKRYVWAVLTTRKVDRPCGQSLSGLARSDSSQ